MHLRGRKVCNMPIALSCALHKCIEFFLTKILHPSTKIISNKKYPLIPTVEYQKVTHTSSTEYYDKHGVPCLCLLVT